ncbi:sphinganine-1-phosphate aldolase [Cladophialophora yegresii CBS 114405]|uniref:sphinganine-1-phosphate aldolase n=1 Tax=Cladophialophora yegresii CBS 114405 TaxID=1182544 RepID=W9W831_9EURO|nr:sphinganine-1-phosphate aldolase [Cladophialophora yegresii CBS 114405]EXJ54704.1 sphinganine-1-phosphate aldolase [Cladophialophora yegresii CBS 114405]
MGGSSPLPLSLQSKFQRARAGPLSRLGDLHTNFNVLRNIIFALFLLRLFRRSFYFLRGHGILGSLALLYHSTHKNLYRMFLNLPGVRSKVAQQLASARADLENKLVPADPGVNRYLHLPKEPWTKEQLSAELVTLSAMKRTRWEEGKVSGAVYHGESALLEIQSEAMKLFSVANPIHADVFPAVRKMEAEIVAMVLALFNAPDTGAGVTTSGGTESILMACLSARQKGYAERGITEPEMIIPHTAHAAFHKAASYFKIKLHVVRCPSPSYEVDVLRVRRLINPNTILLVGSAPNYPHGIVDPIPSLAKLALAYKIPLHVDCCLGSFLMPCLAKAGFPSPFAEEGGFDFRLPGVTSISVDTHKYGFAPKGNSCILYRDRQLREYQYFIAPGWSGGVYGSPSIAGSRPGALIAGCWASMMAVGEKGYIDATHKIVSTKLTIENAVKEHPVLKSALRILGKPSVSVVAFESLDPEVSIYDVADGMSRKGWHLNSLQDPPGVHVAVTLPMTRAGAVDTLIDDLVAVVKEEKEKILSQEVTGSGVVGGTTVKAETRKKGNSAQLYGVAGSLPDKSIVEKLVVAYLDTLYKA